MQQPMPQNDQMAAQQLQQQMVLCPVRVVYETQILVQPGDQIQPNQTLFINPQNPPPWAQNRPVQNQVFYVQQMPGNIVPSLPQHVDQNQLYLHQYPQYQQGMQVVPQHMVQNMQERNTIQMPNIVHQNMLPNFQNNMTSNIGQNVTMDRTVQANYGQMQSNMQTNMQIQPQTQISTANNNVSRPNEIITMSQQQQQQNQFQSQKVDVKPTFMHVGHMNQSPNIGRTQPQVLTVNPIQNVQQTTNIQTFAPNMVRPIKTETVGPQAAPPTYVNASQNTQITRIRKLSPSNNVNKINTNMGVRSIGQTQTYRSIQPRPQFRPNLQNYSPISQANPMPTINQNIMNSHIPVQTMNANPINIIRSEDVNVNRKRKSESPDEIHKKMAAIQVNITTPMKQINDIKKSTEMAMNTSPIQRNEVTITPSILQPNNMKINIMSQPGMNNDTQLTDVQNMSNFIQSVQQAIKMDQSNLCMPNLDPIEPQVISIPPKDTIQNKLVDKDKLIRNTVFTQARGRVLTDKELKECTLPESVCVLKEITVTPREAIINDVKPIMPKDEVIVSKNEVKLEGIVKAEDKNIIKEEKKADINNVESKVETKEHSTVEISNAEVKNESKDKVKEERKEPADMKVSLHTMNNKGMFPVERSVKQEKDYILTHVLDGIVIQESNVAFPIREPLIKRITQSTALSNETKEAVKEEKKVENTGTKANETSQSKENIQSQEEVTQGDNPFRNINSETLKSWTTEQLLSHLSRHGWSEAAALLSEHEIDGESLHLVSKAQLLAIGVEEGQADALCSCTRS